MAGAVHDVECVDRRAGLGINSRKPHKYIFAVEAAEHIVKQTDAVRGLKLDERVSRKRFVVDRDARWKLDSDCGATARALRFFDGWIEVEVLVLKRLAQGLLDKFEIAGVGNRLRFRVAHAENAKHRVVATRK